MNDFKLKKTGLVLGKFMPPHAGHVYLINFAKNYVENLLIVVGTLASEPISGQMRFEWMKELFPEQTVLHLTDENPQHPDEHPDFWKIWEKSLKKILPTPPDFVFASENYGQKLSEILGATFVPVNLKRNQIPISGTQIRESPFKHWEYLPSNVRCHYTKRICVFGPESTGKTTLSSQLANHYHTVCVQEYAREWLEFKNSKCTSEDIPMIARGQAAAEAALLPFANKILFMDTDILSTTIWSDAFFQKCSSEVNAFADNNLCDSYLLLDVDVPWIQDSQRYFPENRKEFFLKCEAALKARNLPYTVISGSWDERFKSARTAVDQFMSLYS